jgi:hypothetical protein
MYLCIYVFMHLCIYVFMYCLRNNYFLRTFSAYSSSFRMEMSIVLEVNETIDCALRRIIAANDQGRLKNKHTNAEAVFNIEYNKNQLQKRRHDLEDERDPGYLSFCDQFRDRIIFIAMKEVGQSNLFHRDYDIINIFNVIKPCSNHQHSTDMTPHQKEWFITNILYVCMQMLDMTGNIVLFCHSGRSRSPMYLVAYLILFNNMTVEYANEFVENLLLEHRGHFLDRHNTLHELIYEIAERFKTCK